MVRIQKWFAIWYAIFHQAGTFYHQWQQFKKVFV